MAFSEWAVPLMLPMHTLNTHSLDSQQFMQATEHSYNCKKKLANAGMVGWRHWLTKYTNKENTIYNIATLISHNCPYISSSKY